MNIGCPEIRRRRGRSIRLRRSNLPCDRRTGWLRTLYDRSDPERDGQDADHSENLGSYLDQLMVGRTQIAEPCTCPGLPVSPFDLFAATATEIRAIEHVRFRPA